MQGLGTIHPVLRAGTGPGLLCFSPQGCYAKALPHHFGIFGPHFLYHPGGSLTMSISRERKAIIVFCVSFGSPCALPSALCCSPWCTHRGGRSVRYVFSFRVFSRLFHWLPDKLCRREPHHVSLEHVIYIWLCKMHRPRPIFQPRSGSAQRLQGPPPPLETKYRDRSPWSTPSSGVVSAMSHRSHASILARSSSVRSSSPCVWVMYLVG